MTTDAGSKPRPICLALQGGGAHGAFEWGVLETLLEDGRLEVKAVTGASAGAMNAAVLATGLHQGGAKGAASGLGDFWRDISESSSFGSFGADGQGLPRYFRQWVQANPVMEAFEFAAQQAAQSLSPYEFNPLNINPLRTVVQRHVDFEALRAASPVKLFISATQVLTSKLRIFRETELTPDSLLASAALPYLFQAVVVDGQPYWDGGFLANPPLWPLYYEDLPLDVLVITLNPFRRSETPTTSAEIMTRMNEINFNAVLMAELRAIAFVHKLIDAEMLAPHAQSQYRDIRLHAIEADAALSNLPLNSKFDTDWDFLQSLHAKGKAAAKHWLDKDFADVGHRSSVDVSADFL